MKRDKDSGLPKIPSSGLSKKKIFPRTKKTSDKDWKLEYFDSSDSEYESEEDEEDEEAEQIRFAHLQLEADILSSDDLDWFLDLQTNRNEVMLRGNLTIPDIKGLIQEYL
jgi:hypothetical protein